MEIGAAGAVNRTLPDQSVSSLESEDFFKLLVTELQQQDPLEPTKTADMIGQVSRIRSIELNEQLGNTLEQIANQQHTGGSSDLIGKFVVASTTDSAGQEAQTGGVVTGVRFESDGTAMLELDTGTSVRGQDVTAVTTVENVAQAVGESNAQATTAEDAKADGTAKPQGERQPWFQWNASLQL